MATYVISDIHGKADAFFDLLNQVQFSDADELYVLGDLIDRGSKSAEIFHWAVEEAPSNVHFLLGNHEDMAESVLARVSDEGSIYDMFNYSDIWNYNGGIQTLNSLREKYGAKWCRKSAQWIRELPIYYIVEVNGKEWLLIHAGLAHSRRMSDLFAPVGRDEDIDIPEIDEIWSQHLVWVRDRWLYNSRSYPYDIVFGHTPTSYWVESFFSQSIAIQGQPGYIVRMVGFDNYKVRYCIDCGYNRLGMLRLDDCMEFYSQKGV